MFDEKKILDALNTVFDGNFISVTLTETMLLAKNSTGSDFSISIEEAKVQGLL